MFLRHFRNISTLTCALLCGALSATNGWAQSPLLKNLVVAGDSVSAGVENFSLEADQQIHGYPSVIAKQAGVPMTLPLVPYPGIPNMLHLNGDGTITPVTGSQPSPPRANPCEQPTNVSVPGVKLNDALNMVPSLQPTSPVQAWATVVLGFPDPFATAPYGPCPVANRLGPVTEIQRAVSLKPTALITWLGNNDILLPAITGNLSLLTSFQNFLNDYGSLLDQLSEAEVPIMTATIPDVTSIAFFTPVSVVANRAGVSTNEAAQRLGIHPDDLLRPTALPIASGILAGQQPGPLPVGCDLPPILQGLIPPPSPGVVPQVACILKAADANTIRQTTLLFNGVIYAQSVLHHAAVADVYSVLQQLAQTGYTAAGRQLTTNFLGGIFSLDGVHPSNTGYGIIANTFIDTMNQSWQTNIRHANVDKIAAQDPLLRFGDSRIN